MYTEERFHTVGTRMAHYWFAAASLHSRTKARVPVDQKFPALGWTQAHRRERGRGALGKRVAFASTAVNESYPGLKIDLISQVE